MKHSRKDLLKAVHNIMEDVDNPATRTNKGQKYLVELKDGTQAIVKTAGKGGLMASTRSKDIDAGLIGYEDDVSHVLAIVCLPNDTIAKAYLIPMNIVIAAFRRDYAKWLEAHPGSGSDTWVLKFNEMKADHYSNMSEEWNEYFIGCTSMVETGDSPKAVTARARADIANAYNVDIEQVHISVDL